MAVRPVFVPNRDSPASVLVVQVEFQWHSGFALQQAQKSIRSLHSGAAKQGYEPLLDISTKSPNPDGVALSAFNLEIEHDFVRMPVECAYQGSKKFANGGPFAEIYGMEPRDAKRFPLLNQSGKLELFKFYEFEFPLIPVTAFYDWLYLRALVGAPKLAMKLTRFNGFTDISFNPERSWNCQARSAAFYCGLLSAGEDIAWLVSDAGRYLSYLGGMNTSEGGHGAKESIAKTAGVNSWEQSSLFGVDD